MNRVFLPLISSSQPAIVPMGWAIYGVPHSVNHQELEAGRWVQDWRISECCLAWPNYMPTFRDIYQRVFIEFDYLADVASRFPGHTCLLWNEPDVPSQAWLNARNAVEMSRRWMQAIRPHWKAAGFGVRVDNPANPANFIIAYCDGAGNVKVDKCVAGTYTNVISGAVTYVAGRVLRLVCSGNNVSAYYNGTQVGSTTAVADAGIVSNVNHGKFSTYASNGMADYVAA